LREEELEVCILAGGHSSATTVRLGELEVKFGSRIRKRYMQEMKEKTVLVTSWI